MPNLRLNAGLGYVAADAAGFDIDGTTYGAGAEYQIGGTPFSVTAGYSHADIEDIDVDTVSVGLRYSFGGGLQARDRAGAALPGSGVMGLLGAL
jgi:long-subunit fatty acid transport protein